MKDVELIYETEGCVTKAQRRRSKPGNSPSTMRADSSEDVGDKCHVITPLTSCSCEKVKIASKVATTRSCAKSTTKCNSNSSKKCSENVARVKFFQIFASKTADAPLEVAKSSSLETGSKFASSKGLPSKKSVSNSSKTRQQRLPWYIEKNNTTVTSNITCTSKILSKSLPECTDRDSVQPHLLPKDSCNSSGGTSVLDKHNESVLVKRKITSYFPRKGKNNGKENYENKNCPAKKKKFEGVEVDDSSCGKSEDRGESKEETETVNMMPSPAGRASLDSTLSSTTTNTGPGVSLDIPEGICDDNKDEVPIKAAMGSPHNPPS